ncbi:MAG TPA: hypothetical protein GXX18_14930 [Bacillales bacterium]|nr:hypothetical protein [Bacillales bacterium]
MNKLYFSIILLLLFVGCSNTVLNNSNKPGPKITLVQAKELAQEIYGLTEINNVELRLLKKNEIVNLTSQQKKLTPVYFVISGQLEGEDATVYVSSNDLNHHFIILTEE